MDLQEYLARMNSGEPVQGGGDMHRFMREINEVTMRLTCELNNKYHTGEEVREIFSKIIGKPVDKSFRLFPPFYTNCGKNTTVGKGVFINTGCHFQDQGGIIVGAGSVVTKDVPPYTIVAGVPARVIRKFDPKTDHLPSTHKKTHEDK